MQILMLTTNIKENKPPGVWNREKLRPENSSTIERLLKHQHTWENKAQINSDYTIWVMTGLNSWHVSSNWAPHSNFCPICNTL